jgi:hypothetical protein
MEKLSQPCVEAIRAIPYCASARRRCDTRNPCRGDLQSALRASATASKRYAQSHIVRQPQRRSDTRNPCRGDLQSALRALARPQRRKLPVQAVGVARLAACRGAERMGALWGSPLPGMRVTIDAGNACNHRRRDCV